MYNIEDKNNKYAFIIGNGKDSSNRSNAFTVDWDGNIVYSGTASGSDGLKLSDKPGKIVSSSTKGEIFNNLDSNTATGNYSHAEGTNTAATGVASHAEGYDTSATGHSSHAGGLNTKAAGQYQTAIGKYNIEDMDNNYAFIIGGGNSDTARKNLITVDWSGNLNVNNIVDAYNFKSTFKGITGLSTSGNYWNSIPYINDKGTINIGKYINFHETSGDIATGTGKLSVESGILKYNDTSVSLSGHTHDQFQEQQKEIDALKEKINALEEKLKTAIFYG